MKNISGVTGLKDKKILVRTDFDIPVTDGKVQEAFRIVKQKKLIDNLIEQGSRVAMVAHVSDIDTFGPIFGQLEDIIGRKINFVKNISELHTTGSELSLLENVRNWPGEKKNSPEFARELAAGFDIYVNNAFAVSHRAHASVSAITKFLPSYAGLILEEETRSLKSALELPREGKIFIMGGAKASTKLPVIKNFLDKAGAILIGGVIANDFLKKQGIDLGASKFDEDFEELLTGLDMSDPKLVMPLDYNIHEGRYLDIGPRSVAKFVEIILGAKIIVWNGPMGLFEDERFSAGTMGVAQAVAASSAFKIIGGGDTIAAINGKIGLDNFNFVSTGGGAMLSFLAGEELPGLEALGYYDR